MLSELYGKIKAIFWLSFKIGIIKTLIILFEIILNMPKEHLVKFKFKNKGVYFFIESKKTDLALLTEIFYFQCYEIKKQINPKLIIDGGSNKGASAVYFSIVYPKAEIHCFEPNEDILPILKKNLKINKVNSKIFPYAISNKEGIVYFEKGKNHQYSKLSKEKTKDKVKVIGLNNLYKHKKIDILKLDVEGEEEKIISSIGKLNIHIIIGEIHHDRVNFSKIIMNLSSNYDLEFPYSQYKFLNSKEEYPIVVFIRKKEKI